MEKISTAMSAYPTGTPASVTPAAASVFSGAAVLETRRRRALVHAAVAAQGKGELCPQTGGPAVVRDADLFASVPGTTVSSGPPV